EKHLNQISNPVIHDITQYLLLAYEDRYFVYPAASRMHHAYVGGLAYHTIGMLDLADSFLKNYPYLNKDYLYAGIILHDIGKILELTGIQNTEYTLDGQLLGHLVMGALEIQKAAIAIGLEDKKEIHILEHMLISHHGQAQFGAAKRPITPEAVALWYIDTIDSKFRVLGEELEKTEVGCYTDTIGVLDKIKIYNETL
uniref:HD domain-containing protein n=1 Tax=Helicobacter typhlonius TaxID=76936 RepID=UPI002FE30ACB